MKKNIYKFTASALLLALLTTGCAKTANQDTSKDDASNNTVTEQPVDQNATAGESNETVDNTDSSETVYPLTMEIYGPDGEKYTQTFTEAPSRVITNNPSSTDLLLELGLEDKIIGILKPDNAPDEKWASVYEKLPVLGDKKSMSKEVIIGAEPDLIFGRSMPFTDESMGTIKDLNDMNINVYTQLASNFVIDQSLDNIILDVRNIGQIFNVSEKADAYADSLQTRLDTIKEKVSNQSQTEPVKVLFMVTYVDGTFNTFGANSTLQSEMLKTINAENVLETGTSSLTSENLVALNPDIIVYINSDRNAETDPIAVESLLNDETIQSVPAIANEKIIEIGYDELMDYGVRIFDTLETLYDFIY
ncbi:ABC transporter substrate-binding protein [Clostridium sp. Marseille-P299]|uniref:ABC transporter substrate-binding protein n=1 Tax=Clostridium sp. Marseille-P299 TaxID=1805477 RepID=UPI00082A4533|nr:ABC transporter substrate-binding protein [Clostridium sp. Marseille-P299]